MAVRRGKAKAIVHEPEIEQPDDLELMSVPDLNALIERATAARDGKIETARQEFIERTRSEAQGLGLSMDDLMPKARPAKSASSRPPVPVKYRDGDRTWSGRGRLPNWLSQIEAEGRSRDEFLVKNSA